MTLFVIPSCSVAIGYLFHRKSVDLHDVRSQRSTPPEFSSNQNLERWANHVLFFPAGHGIQLSVNLTLFRGPDGEVMTPTSFIDASKCRHAFVFPPIIPEGHQKIFSLTEQRWRSWWKALRKIRRVHSDAEDTAHLLSLGSLHPGVQLSSATHSQLNNRSASCVMCLSEAPESLPHLARRLVELRILFFHSIWKLSRRRRFSSQPLEPITESELEELRGSIRGARVASLLYNVSKGGFDGYGRLWLKGR
ncbi:BQ2448_3538 [Microbotryum intermedium]|uniref:BQ2448_3538 protein n=1 Tax=Microbotryum intermedium TaxID=269621 RepID=A0A238FI75_9BASI|nr:BQ2448_3538 [Microbotryum intermedium]